MTTELEVPDFHNRFAPRLNFETRCAIFALHHHERVPYSVLATAFGVHHRTIFMICDMDGKLYKNIHREHDRMGLLAMYDQYVRNEHVKKVIDANNGRIAAPKPVFNKAANRQEGFHRIENSMWEIRWQEQMDDNPNWKNPGWAVNLNDMGWVGDSDRNGEPFRTSHEALRWCEKNSL